ncbi:MAG: TetR/AcrR family transcriptional regulator [Bacillota bacterium]
MGAKSDTKKKIIEKARKLFAERGFNGATTAEIARHVGVSEAALYKHFKSKKEIFLACITPSVVVNIKNNEDPDVHDIIQARMELVRSNLDSFNILFREYPYHPELAKMFLDQVYTQDKHMKHLMKKVSNEKLTPAQSLMYEIGITSAIWAILNFEKVQEQVLLEKMPLGNVADEIAKFVLSGVSGKKEN